MLYEVITLYLPEGQIPMLPRHLSQGVCSLIQGEVRAAFSYMILLSPDAEVLRVRIKPSVIKVARRLTYEEVDKSALLQNLKGQIFVLQNSYNFV